MPTPAHVPQGQLKKAQRFNAGKTGQARAATVPPGTAENRRRVYTNQSSLAGLLVSVLPAGPSTEVLGYYQWSLTGPEGWRELESRQLK